MLPAMLLKQISIWTLHLIQIIQKQISVYLFIALSLTLLIINLLMLILCKILCHLNAEQFFLDNTMWS